jgi:hypothetical protein
MRWSPILTYFIHRDNTRSKFESSQLSSLVIPLLYIRYHGVSVHEQDAPEAALGIRRLPHRLYLGRRLGKVFGDVQTMASRTTRV